MFEIRTDIEIASPASRVWSILVDFPRHPDWNPFVRSISGSPLAGTRLKVSVQPPGGRGMTFRPIVLEANPNRALRWRGQLLFPGLFDGEHYFEIEELSSTRVRFIHGEKFFGILVGMAKSSLDGPTRAGFVAMNEALKARAESEG